MAITLVSGQTFVEVGDHWPSGTASAAKDLPAPATAGNLIIVVVRVGDGTGTGQVTGIDDAGTTSFARAKNQQDSTTGNFLEIWWGIAAGASAGQDVVVTINAAAPSADNWIAIMEFAGNESPQASITSNGANTASTTTHDSGSVTPATANNVIVAASSGSSRTWTNDADFTQLLNNSRSLLAYKIQSSATAQSYTGVSDVAGFACMAIAAFTGVADATSVPRMLLLGVG